MFKFDIYPNNYLPVGGTRVDAVFNITPTEAAVITKPTKSNLLIGLIGDNSGSMSGEKIQSLKTALRLTVDILTDDQQFFIIVFNSTSKVIIGPCFATRENKLQAHTLIQKIEASGGTCMSRALSLAREIARKNGENAVCQIYFLTDGENNDDDNHSLKNQIEACAGLFQVHCRGVGTDWKPEQLRLISNGLLGTLDIVARPEKLKEDFENTLRLMTSKTISDVQVKLWVPNTARISMFKQVFPTEIDITNKIKVITEKDPTTQKDKTFSVISLGAWGTDTQDYYIAFDVTAGNAGEERLVCRPSLAYVDSTGSNVSVPAQNITVKWTEDVSLSARINEQVAHYTGQQEKAKAIQEGLEALAQQNIDVATNRLGRALKLASDAGDEGTVRRLKQIVDVVDADKGTVRVKRGQSKEELMDLDVASTRTVRANRK